LHNVRPDIGGILMRPDVVFVRCEKEVEPGTGCSGYVFTEEGELPVLGISQIQDLPTGAVSDEHRFVRNLTTADGHIDDWELLTLILKQELRDCFAKTRDFEYLVICSHALEPEDKMESLQQLFIDLGAREALVLNAAFLESSVDSCQEPFVCGSAYREDLQRLGGAVIATNFVRGWSREADYDQDGDKLYQPWIAGHADEGEYFEVEVLTRGERDTQWFPTAFNYDWYSWWTTWEPE
jgi:hypothetical protein